MNEQTLDLSKSPLSLREIQRIDELNLPMFEKHQLRLLAHCLGVFKSISSKAKSLPSEEDQLRWCKANPSLQADSEFIELLLSQFAVAAKALEMIAQNIHVEPMDLTLNDLINEALKNKKSST